MEPALIRWSRITAARKKTLSPALAVDKRGQGSSLSASISLPGLLVVTLATAGVCFWTDIVWHVIWGGLSRKGYPGCSYFLKAYFCFRSGRNSTVISFSVSPVICQRSVTCSFTVFPEPYCFVSS